MIGLIKEIRTQDGQHVAIVETGSGPAVTATVMQSGNADFCPMPGDRVLFHRNGREIVISAIFAQTATAGMGETLIFARNAEGAVTATFHLKADGTVAAGAGSDAVAMGAKTDAIVSVIASTATGQVCASPGSACPFATALKAAMEALPSVASTNLKAD